MHSCVGNLAEPMGDGGIGRILSGLAWPSRTWMMRTSAPLSSRWVANVCRSVCTVTCLLTPAAAQAERQAACKTLGTSGLVVAAGKQPALRPGEPPIRA